jgi:MFS family permease
LIGLAGSWSWIVVANVLLGASQGLAWSMTVLMKIDLAGPRRRGLALGLNESAGYLGVALAAAATGALAATFAPHTVVWVGALALATAGLVLTLAFVRETARHVAFEQAERGDPGRQPGVLAACSQAGFVNNANDALAWGLLPLYLAASGASIAQIGVVAGVYPAVWGLAQLPAGALSDLVGRRPLIVAGMLVQAAAFGVVAAGGGAFGPTVAGAVLLGLGTALVYPTLLGAVADAVEPRERARAVGRYRFWRDAGLVGGALSVGLLSDALGSAVAIVAAGAATGASGLIFLALTQTSLERRRAWQLT